MLPHRAIRGRKHLFDLTAQQLPHARPGSSTAGASVQRVLVPPSDGGSPSVRRIKEHPTKGAAMRKTAVLTATTVLVLAGGSTAYAFAAGSDDGAGHDRAAG